MSRFAEDGPGAGRQAAVVVSDRPNRRVCFETRGFARGGATSAGGSGLSCLCAPSTPATTFIDDCVMITGRCVECRRREVGLGLYFEYDIFGKR